VAIAPFGSLAAPRLVYSIRLTTAVPSLTNRLMVTTIPLISWYAAREEYVAALATPAAAQAGRSTTLSTTASSRSPMLRVVALRLPWRQEPFKDAVGAGCEPEACFPSHNYCRICFPTNRTRLSRYGPHQRTVTCNSA
jgi:hypothetical protein